jgi:hypothetical protein
MERSRDYRPWHQIEGGNGAVTGLVTLHDFLRAEIAVPEQGHLDGL